MFPGFCFFVLQPCSSLCICYYASCRLVPSICDPYSTHVLQVLYICYGLFSSFWHFSINHSTFASTFASNIVTTGLWEIYEYCPKNMGLIYKTAYEQNQEIDCRIIYTDVEWMKIQLVNEKQLYLTKALKCKYTYHVKLCFKSYKWHGELQIYIRRPIFKELYYFHSIHGFNGNVERFGCFVLKAWKKAIQNKSIHHDD